MTGIITIKPEREKPVLNQHPWVFSGAVDRVEGNPQPGDIVTLVSRKGRFLARGYYNPKSQIVVRILTWQDEPIDDDWWRRMLDRAIQSRENDHSWQIGDAYRLVNAESDYIPGLIVDRYAQWLSLQALTFYIDQQKRKIARMLVEICAERFRPIQILGVFERSDVDVRSKEGLSPEVGLLWGEEPPDRIQITEDGIAVWVDIRKGHKTGFYLDQRENRTQLFKVANWHFPTLPNIPRNITVLNLFSYSGAFGLHVLELGAKVINVDSSYEALELAEENVKLNNVPLDRVEFIQANVFEYLRDMRDNGEQYDIIVLDPPKFAQSAQQVERAARGYKDLNLHAFQCVKPGGYLMTFSCSGAISADLFQKIVFGALADSGRQAQILRHLGPGEDHPVALTFPEGAYLKGLLLRVY